MSTAVMMERIAKESPRFKARIAGVLYLLIMLTPTSKQQRFNSMFRRTHCNPLLVLTAQRLNVLLSHPVLRFGRTSWHRR
jgi:hypothetical protein